jgi:hypothetical protein
MNETAQIIVAIATLVTAMSAAIISLVNTLRIGRVAGNVETIEKATNSMKDALVSATAKASLAEGTALGLQQGRDEGRPSDDPIKVDIVKIPTPLKP